MSLTLFFEIECSAFRALVTVGLGVVGEVVMMEAIALASGLAMKGIVLQIVFDAVAFEVKIVFFTAKAAVANTPRWLSLGEA